jgi:putative ABC transport system permease protein
VLRWAWKSLLSQRAGLLGSAAGVAGAFILVIFFDAVFRGESEQIVAYIKHSQPDVWVMQGGVSNMHMASSYIWDWKADKIAAMPGVVNVTPILYLNTAIKIGGNDYFGYVVGLLEDSKRGGPWSMAAGRATPNEGEAVIPATFSRITDVGMGDSIFLTDRELEVVGLSEGTYSMANPIIFVAFPDLEDIVSSTGTFSYLLVDAVEGTDVRELGNRIEAEVEKVNAMAHGDFIDSDFKMAMHMGVEIIAMMTVIGSALAALIVAFTAYTHVMRKRRELAISKALGFHNSSIYAGVILQSAVITLLGFLLAAAFAFVVMPQISALVPQVTLVVSAGAVAKVGLVALGVAVLASLIPAYLVSRLAPASVFQI